jgi:hypothetical protein
VKRYAVVLAKTWPPQTPTVVPAAMYAPLTALAPMAPVHPTLARAKLVVLSAPAVLEDPVSVLASPMEQASVSMDKHRAVGFLPVLQARTVL